mmetsp:Transcript_24051/g.67300  ORF Transcript_24051/g.67300 Transcript_24051/m.67300 type:complete len:334 (+) Transcript_24051:757-1758(+)
MLAPTPRQGAAPLPQQKLPRALADGAVARVRRLRLVGLPDPAAPLGLAAKPVLPRRLADLHRAGTLPGAVLPLLLRRLWHVVQPLAAAAGGRRRLAVQLGGRRADLRGQALLRGVPAPPRRRCSGHACSVASQSWPCGGLDARAARLGNELGHLLGRRHAEDEERRGVPLRACRRHAHHHAVHAGCWDELWGVRVRLPLGRRRSLRGAGAGWRRPSGAPARSAGPACDRLEARLLAATRPLDEVLLAVLVGPHEASPGRRRRGRVACGPRDRATVRRLLVAQWLAHRLSAPGASGAVWKSLGSDALPGGGDGVAHRSGRPPPVANRLTQDAAG